jgi:hypothetical protein
MPVCCMLVRLVSGYGLLMGAITACVCPDDPSYVRLETAAPAEPARNWKVGDTASVWAELWYGQYDVRCAHFASRASTNYEIRVEPDSFTFQSSRPDVATITNRGLVTALGVGQTEIRATSAGIVSGPLRITVR